MEESEAQKPIHGHPKIKIKKLGGMITMPSILGNEVCEKLAVVGFNANMISYLTTQLHMPLTQAANTVTNFGGASSFTPLIGAFIADSFAGRFWTVTIASIVYTIGMSGLTVSAVLPQLRPPPCQGGDSPCQQANGGQLAILYISLLLGAIGAGGIRPCVVAFGADQFDESDPKQSTRTWKYFNWYYFVMGVSMLVAVTVLVYVQDNVGWGWGLGIPTVAMALSVVALLLGYPLYRKLEPDGSPFTRLLQVSVAAYRKRKLAPISDPKMLYHNWDWDAGISMGGNLIHTKQMRFLDKAAILTESEEGRDPNPWRVNSVHRVEELKSVIRMGPIWAAAILLITAYAQQNTFSLQQAKTMNRHLSRSFEIPAGSMTVFTYATMLLTIALYDRLLVPLARRLTRLDRGISFLHRMAVGFLISIAATLVAGFVELRRKTASPSAPLSVFWLVPQYGLHGMAEAFMSIGHLEFFYDQAPESMRSTAMALFWLAISMGNYVSTLLVSLVHRYSAGPDGSNWLPDTDLNEGKLEYFYWLITALQVVNFVYYLICMKYYTFKPVQMKNVDGDKEDGAIELHNRV